MNHEIPSKPEAIVELLPLGKVVKVERGTPLQDLLFVHGVEFPCGGQGLCKSCKIRVIEGSLPVSADEERRFTATELAAGWRMACRGRVEGNLRLELAQWEAAILGDDTPMTFTPQPGLGLAVDLGTTTLVAQLVDLETCHVVGVRAELNGQAQFGSDIMSRVDFAVAADGRARLEKLIREQIGRLAQELLDSANPAAGKRLERVVVVGNTVMHHLFCGLRLEPLAHFPFEPLTPGGQRFDAASLAWELRGNPVVRFLPCLGGFVGSDLLAGILATQMHESHRPVALLDLGTNGEIVVGNRDRLLCASTAAGPAFEGARISMGMRAATGAISAVRAEGGALSCHVLGHVAPRGICGSGLVDAVAAGLDLGWIQPNGRLANGGGPILLAPPVSLTQRDVRELQLAKGAIAAGLRILLEQWGANVADLERVYLAGAFGNYINYASARRIGLLDFPPEQIHAAGNTALRGAKLALFDVPAAEGGDYSDILARARHVSLNEDARFQDLFAQEMGFPKA